MSKSIKWRITIIFVIVMLICFGSIFAFNSIFLERFYIRDRTNVLKKTYKVLDEGVLDAYSKGYKLKDLFLYNKSKKIQQEEVGPGVGLEEQNSNESSLRVFLKELQDTYNVSIVLVDEDNKFYSLYENNQRFDRRLISYIFQNNENDKNLKVLEKNEKFTIAINTSEFLIPTMRRSTTANNNFASNNNNNNNTENITSDQKPSSPRRVKYTDIECVGFLSDNVTSFLMITPLVSLREPIDLFNRILIIVTLVIVFIGSILIYINAYNISKPINKLALLSKKMSELDFDTKYIGNRKDEIGILGKSMNEMSIKLENTIRELKNANIQLKSDIEQKEKLDNMRREFIASVSHELKTPIALIQGYAEGLQYGMADKKEDRDFYVEVIIDEANKMNRMVKQLLELSSLEKDINDIDITRINLLDFVNHVVKSQDIILKQNNIDVKISIDSSITVWVDEFKFEEVVRNYLTNAINHVDENKDIRIWVENISSDKVRLYVYNSGNQLSEDNLSNIWEKFYKTDKARTRAYGGTGLGLSIVKAIADKHNTSCGCINVDEDYNIKKGIKFYFDINTK